MKNECAELQQKIDEMNDKMIKSAIFLSEKYHSKGLPLTGEGQRIRNELDLLSDELRPLTTRRDELLNKIRIREEALDLLQELGIIDDNLKQSSIMNTIKSLF